MQNFNRTAIKRTVKSTDRININKKSVLITNKYLLIFIHGKYDIVNGFNMLVHININELKFC